MKILKKIVRSLAPRIFMIFEKYFHIHITPVHYSSPIPNVSKLDPKLFNKIYDDTGINWNVDDQIKLFDLLVAKYSNEYRPLNNAGLSLVDSFLLYAIIRETKPKIIIEVGSGESTKISLLALERNEKEGAKGNLIAIEPYPNEHLKKLKKENFTLINSKLEDVNIDLLVTADLLFIDSSHVSKIGSDVNYEILEIIPKLKRGAIIHWHDIMIPMNYWRDWMYQANMFWNESYLLHAFLLFNENFKIIWGSRYMQIFHPGEIKDRLAYFDKKNHRCTSFWVKRVE